MGLRDNAIVAYAETKVMEKSDRNVWVLSGEILEALLDKTGIDKNEIDGLVMAGLTGTGAANPFWAQTTADVLGLEVGFCEQVHTGGCSAAGCVARAAAAIDYGMCEVAFLLFADTHVLEDRTDHSHTYRREWTEPYGLMGPPGAFGLLSRAYEAKYGLDYRMLGKLAVTQRNHALMNENACEKLRVPITIDDYMNSRMIAEPIRLLDCVMRADGAAGLIMMSRKRAKEKGLSKCIIPIGYAELTNFKGGENLVDPTKSGHEICGRKALAAAGLGIKDIASFHPYDDFIIAIMLQLEAFGFCKAGEGVPFIRDHDFSYNGDLPLNTGGGQISAGQAACSSHNLVEAVRQLQGEAGQASGEGYEERAGDRHRLDQLRTQLGHERGPGAGPGMSEATMTKALNDTLSVKRAIKHFDFSEPYWEGTKQKKLVIQYCKATGKYQHFPRPVSIFTGRRRDIEWREVSGKGVVFSYTVTHRGTAAFRGVEPYAVVSVTLDVGVNFIADIVNCTVEDLKVGMKVKPYWHPLDDGTHLMLFQPDNGAA